MPNIPQPMYTTQTFLSLLLVAVPANNLEHTFVIPTMDINCATSISADPLALAKAGK